MPHAVLCVLGLLMLQTAHGQAARPLPLSPDLAVTQYVHETWQVKDGLPQTIVNDVLQTRDGYLWLATQEGLARFDGVSFTVFENARVQGLESNTIRVLRESRDGALWIGTEGGLTRYQNGTFETFTTPEALSRTIVRALYEDRQGTLWAGTIGKGLFRFDGVAFAAYPLPGDPLDELSQVVLSIAERPDGTLLVGTASGLFEVFTSAAPIRSEPILPAAVWSLLAEADGTVWAGTDRGLYQIRDGTASLLPEAAALRDRTITALTRDPAGSLWIGTREAGLFRLAGDRLSPPFGTREGLTHPFVRALFVDREGSIWIGTDGGGLNRLRPGKFVPIRRTEGLSSDVVMTVMEDRSGVLWTGTEGGGLNRIEHGRIRTFTRANGLPSDNVYALHQDRRGRVWAGTGSGVCRFEADASFTCLDGVRGLAGETVYSIHEDRDGTVWIGTMSGLVRLRDDRIVPLPEDWELAGELVRTILEAEDGTLWFGADLGGLYRLRDGELRRFTRTDGLSSDYILTLQQDDDGVLWIGTNGGGLCRFLDASPECFAAIDGLYGDKILQILDDGRGALWLGSLSGVYQIRKDAFDAFSEGRSTTISARAYDEMDGLPHREMNGGTSPAAWRSRDGRLWFATVAGLAYFDPDEALRNHIAPPVRIERLFLDGAPAAMVPDHSFAPGTRNVAFTYTALSLAASQKIQFQFRLQGYDDHWIDAGTRRQAFYTNLAPGTYRFQVRAGNSDGAWNWTGAEYTFQIEPFFYQTPWFYLLCAALLLLCGVTLYRGRVHHLRARQAELTALVAEQTRELREREQALQALNANLQQEVQRQLDLILEERNRYEKELIDAKEKAEASARLKTTILRNMSHEIRTPLTAILGFSQVLSEEVDPSQREFVTYISENGRRLLSTLNAILDLAKLEQHEMRLEREPVDVCATARESVALLAPVARQRGLVLRAETPAHAITALLDRNGLERILQNLIGNALKFTDEGEVVVTVSANDAQVCLQVRDTGIGIDEAFLPHVFEEFTQESSGLARSHEGSGLGLAITHRLVEAHGGTISVDSAKHKGTTFTVLFPMHTPAQAATLPEHAQPRAGALEPEADVAAS